MNGARVKRAGEWVILQVNGGEWAIALNQIIRLVTNKNNIDMILSDKHVVNMVDYSIEQWFEDIKKPQQLQQKDALVMKMASLRLSHDMSLRQLSKITGVSFSTLSRLERGVGLPDKDVRIKIAKWVSDKKKEG